MPAPVSRSSAIGAWITQGIILTLAAGALAYGMQRLSVTGAIQARFAADPSCRQRMITAHPPVGACRLVEGRIIGPVSLTTGRRCPCVDATIALPDGREASEHFSGRIAVAVLHGSAPTVLLFHDRIADYYSREDFEPTSEDPEEAVMSDQGLVAWGGLMLLIFVLPLTWRAITLQRSSRKRIDPSASRHRSLDLPEA